MEGLFRLLLVAGLLAAVLPAAAATFGPQPGPPCEPTLLATQVALFCAPDMPTARCCEPVVAAVDLGGGVPCLCRVAAEPQLVMAGLNATHLLTLYTSCGGLRPGGAHLAAACEGPAPPAAAVSAPRSAALHREAPAPLPGPPAPPSTEKPSLRPQQHDGIAHFKAVPAYVATSPLAPAAAYDGPAPPAAVVRAPPPSPGPRRKQPAHEAPHPPPSTQKPSLPPQQHDSAASKAFPAYAATSLLAPAPAAVWEGSLLSQVDMCTAAVPLTSSVAMECGSHLSQEACCLILREAVEKQKPLVCLCVLAISDAVKEARLTMRDLVNAYAECNTIRPGDTHLPSRGCAQVLNKSGSPPPSFQPVETRSAPPPAGRLLATSSSSAPYVSSDHWILVAIFVCLILIGIMSVLATIALFYKRGNFEWARMTHGVEDEGRRLNDRPMVFITNNGLPVSVAAESTSSAVLDINSAAKEIVEQAEILRRHSPRLAGETPHPGL